MFSGAPRLTAAAEPLPHAPTIGDLRDALDRLSVHDGAGLSETELVEHLTAMEQLKSGLAAAQARVTATLASQRSEAEAAAGVAADERCRGLGHERSGWPGRSHRSVDPSISAWDWCWSTSSPTPSPP